ncbi:MAG: hypothetical protein AAFX89_06375 [Pseudomonadota bacterium]
MKNAFLPLLIITAGAAVPATAQQINGASVSVASQSVEGEFIGDFDATSFAAGLDFGITPTFAIGGAIESVNSDEFEDDIFVATARGMYTSGAGAIGAYYSLESSGDSDTTLYGVEGAYRSGLSSFEGYFGAVDSDLGDDITSTLGFSFEFGVGAGFSLGVDYQAFRVDDGLIVVDTGEIVDATIGDTALLARYSFVKGASVYAKAGRIRAFGDGEDDFTRILGIEESEYITLGAQYDFQGGSLFDARTLFSFGG